MRILHLVTLLSPDGAYGGPLRVAVNGARQLASQGHDVELAAGYTGETSPPSHVDGVRISLFPAYQVVPRTSFSGLFSPGLATFVRRQLKNFDIVHIHAGRDLISVTNMQLAHNSGVPYVVQTHGMIMPDGRLRSRVFDALAVRRLLAFARHQLVLTRRESEHLPEVLRGPGSTVQLNNGLPLPALPSRTEGAPEVLFCARLHPRKRPAAFVEMAAELLRRGTQARFVMVGPDDGALAHALARISELGVGHSVTYEGALPYETVLERVGRATVYVLPSVDEPFPMSLLEAMSLGVPSVCTDTCGVAEELRRDGAALITDGSTTQMADAVSRLLDDPEVREAQGARGRAAVREHYSIEAVGEQLERIYESALAAAATNARARP